MTFPKKVIIATDLSKNMEEVLAPLVKLQFLKEAEIHIVHIFQTTNYSQELNISALLFPQSQDWSSIEHSVIAKISSIVEKVLPYGHSSSLKIKCLFAEKPSQAFCDYAREQNGDLLIVSPRKHKGLFESSFANYITRHSDAPVLMLK